MHKNIKKLFGVIKKRRTAIIAGVVVLIILIATLGTRNGANSHDFLVAQRRDVLKGVNLTGQVKPVESVNLSFEQTGTVASVLADIGDSVEKGQTLVTLRNSDVIALLNQAEAQADAEQAKLSDLINNAGAEQDLENSYNDVLNTVNNALAKAEDAVRSKTSNLFSGSKSSVYNLSFSTCNSAISASATTLKLMAELELDKWDRELRSIGISPTQSELDTTLTNAQTHLDIVEQFVDATNKPSSLTVQQIIQHLIPRAQIWLWLKLM